MKKRNSLPIKVIKVMSRIKNSKLEIFTNPSYYFQIIITESKTISIVILFCSVQFIL